MRSILLIAAVMFTAADGEAAVSFNRDIRPIMSDTCFVCHGPDKGTRMAGLRLDLREEALKANKTGVAPIVPGDPDKSAIVQRVFATGAKLMPPKYSHKELSEAQKNTIRQWVAEGAKYEGHWAYEPVKRPAVPEGAAHPVDAFIRARLAKEGLKPSPEADRRTLIRRVSLDLTGLPPSTAEVEAFAAGKSPDAYRKLVDRLLASPRYAEKQAMHWLDAVRYADTCGFHGDNPFPAWPYRDYVLRAFRDNKPFDVFTREQIAGDLIPGGGTEQKVASAYNRMNRTSAEGGIQPKEYLAKYAADRVRTTSNVWLGSTMGCSECHDHKFDPFTSRDFYAMKAFFADIKETGLVPDRGPKAWGSLLSLPSEAQSRKLAELRVKLARVESELDRRSTDMGARQTEWEKDILRRDASGELNWRYQRPVSASASAAKLTVYNDDPVDTNSEAGGSLVTGKEPGNGLVVASGPNPDNETYTVTFKPGAGEWTALGVEVVADESLPGVRVARGSDRLVITEVEAEAGGRRLDFALATSGLAFPATELLPMNAIDGDRKTGWGLTIYGNNTHFLALRLREKLKTDAGSVLTVRLRHDSEYRQATTGRFRLALSDAVFSWPDSAPRGRKTAEHTSSGLPEDVRKALKLAPEKRTREQAASIVRHMRWAMPEFQALLEEQAKLEAEIGRVEAMVPQVVVTEAAEDPEVTRVLPRGNWMDESGEIVAPAIPAFLGKVAAGRRATRLDLADWLVSKENPLTARVFVNRMWRQLFGAGLSKVLEDLGSQGEWPTHPELLDWLAAEFMQPEHRAGGAHGWNVKHLLRTIVLSETYRQSSISTPELDAKDPDNRLLARQSRFRVDAEQVRDVALAASGLLTETFGGPSVRPYQPEGYLAALNFPKREYSASRGEDLYRRGLYTFWQRTFLHPSMAAFDAPTREECVINRSNSNTPLQALVLLNDPVYVEAARVMAQNMMKGAAKLDQRIDWAFQRAVSRRASAAEQRTLARLYQNSLRQYRANPAEAKQLLSVGEAPLPQQARAPELAALTTLARAILNMHETVTRN
jgi:mono/diheme cytochrome c family protein